MIDDKKCAECGATGELTRLEYKGKKTPWLCPKCSMPAAEGIAEQVVKDIDERINKPQTNGDIVTKKKTKKKSQATTDDLRLLPMTTKMLACALTPAELQEYGQELANVIENKATEEVRQENFKKEMKATLSGLDAEIAVLSSKIRQREERRDVQVQPEMDFKKSIYRETRTDTGAIITERPLTEDERQEALPFEKSDAGAESEKNPDKSKAKKNAGAPTFDQPATA